MPTPQTSSILFFSSFLSRSLKVVFATSILLFLSGCATGGFGENFLAESIEPVSLPKGSVALIMSEASTKTLKELETYNRHYKSGLTAGIYMNSIRQAYVDTSDPEFSVTEVTRMLEARIGKVKRFHTFEEAARSGIKLIVKLDMQTRLINDRSSDPASYLSLEFYAPDRQYLGAVKSMSRRTLTPVWTGYKREKEIVSDIRQQGEIQAHALDLLEQKLARVPLKG